MKFPFSENCFYCVIEALIIIAVYECWEGITKSQLSALASGKPRNESSVVLCMGHWMRPGNRKSGL